MADADDLRQILQRIDRKGYKAYRDIKGRYDWGEYTVLIDHVQGDPFAAPSRFRVRLSRQFAGFPPNTFRGKSRRVALEDFLTRAFEAAAKRHGKGRRGTGKGGIISIDRPGQEVLERTSVFVTDGGIEARFRVGLPAFGRSVAGRIAETMLFDELPRIVRSSLFYTNLDADALQRQVEVIEDADFLRAELAKRGLIAFVADGAVLPRASGIDPGPLATGPVVVFEAPDSLRVECVLPNRGAVSGMGIPAGVTLIVGGGYHGKSTLLRALELGIYNHVPGDGREYVVSDPDTVKIRAEDGRRVEKVDVSPFIDNLPFKRDTRAFSTEEASGSTSQAANIIEALEVGACVLLMDEDTSATNFMIRDHRMQELVSKDREPITPFIDKVRQLYEEHGVSTVLALGGSGDYFDVADQVICMVDYKPLDYSTEARKIAEKHRAERRPEGGPAFGIVGKRSPLAGSFDPSRGKREVKISSRGLKSIEFGTHRIDLGAIEQLIDSSQTRAIGDAIVLATRYMDGSRTLDEVVASVLAEIDERGLDVLSSLPEGDYARFRVYELAAAVNRLRTLSVKSQPGR
jgi:predicted ABC-class ATPase